MRIKNIVDEDFVNYHLPSMFIGTCFCGGKCCTEANMPLYSCQNDVWRTLPIINIKNSDIVNRYLKNPITQAIVIGGLEPFEQWDELKELIQEFRSKTDDDIVIYTGYYPQELDYKLRWLTTYDNIIVKFGRYVPNCDGRYDDILGVTLASNNQFAANITKEFVENLEKKEKQVDFS